jgi:hypothetical protein
LYVQGQAALLVHPCNGNFGASFDKKRCLRKSCATAQLAGTTPTLIACHCLGMLDGLAVLRIVVNRFTLELIGIE